MSKSFDGAVTCAAAIACLVLASLPASAQGGTAEERTACMSDAMALCASAIPDEERIEACLRRQSTRISAACRMVLDSSTAVEQVANSSMHRNGKR